MNLTDPTTWPLDGLYRATLGQWESVATGAASYHDWDSPTRLAGWTARTLLGHLVVVAEAIPATLDHVPTGEQPVSVYDVFAGAPRRAAGNDERAREIAAAGPPAELVSRLTRAVAALRRRGGPPPDGTVLPTRFGPLPVADFLVHRCVEGVVHGLDLPRPAAPNADALDVAAAALAQLLERSSPGTDAALPPDQQEWVEVATGRRPPPAGPLAELVPVLS
jgi:uncharacterized protein (TIGR03083 family)